MIFGISTFGDHFNTIASNFRNCHLADKTVPFSLLLLRRSLSVQSGSFCRYVRLTELMLCHSGVCTGQVRFSVIIIIIIIIKIGVRDFCIFVPGISYVAYINIITTIPDKTAM